MRKNQQLSDALHVLLHMAEDSRPLTSEALAAAMRTNPVVLRRLMGGLRDAGLVASEKGHGGGWLLCCSLEGITLGDVYQALGAPNLISLGFREERPTCLVALVVNEALGDAAREAESLLLRRFEGITLSELSLDFQGRMADLKGKERSLTHRLKDHFHENI